MSEENKFEFCPECAIGLSNAQRSVGYCNNCHCDFNDQISEAKKEWDGLCRCGHKHSEHGKSGSINYTAGKCSVAGCNCKHFLMEQKTDAMQSIEIKDERDYAIRKGKILEKFQQDFFTKFMHNDIYRKVWESLIRDDDPYRIIEQLIEINAEQFRKIKELVELIPVQPIPKP